MDPDLRARAERRLQEAAAEFGLTDPRPPLREQLRRLRETRPDAFSGAVRHYEAEVLPALDADPVGTWLEYARFIGQLTAEGRLVAVDGSGRAMTYRPPLRPGVLVLFVPDDSAAAVLPAAAPLACTPAQQATLDLLVAGRLALGGGGA
ncbi:MAG TPA: hypothetical protein VK936_11260 [Longimicrobiales bacterium]|nr:hypothetical protein [Longimicrobiales bacterium]